MLGHLTFALAFSQVEMFKPRAVETNAHWHRERVGSMPGRVQGFLRCQAVGLVLGTPISLPGMEERGTTRATAALAAARAEAGE